MSDKKDLKSEFTGRCFINLRNIWIRGELPVSDLTNHFYE